MGARHTPYHLAAGSLNITLLYAAKSVIRWTDGVADLYTTSRLTCGDLRRVLGLEMVANQNVSVAVTVFLVEIPRKSNC